jgi:copper chaperone CopZ
MSEHENCHVEPVEKPVDYASLDGAQAAFLSVSGMGCSRCADRVQNGLLLQEGVVFAEVSLETGSAAVGYDPVITTEADLVSAVARSGDDGRHRYRAFILQTIPAREAFFFPPDSPGDTDGLEGPI